MIDPPYGITKCRWDKTALDLDPLWPELNRILKPGGTVIIFGLGRFSASVIRSNREQYRYKLIWEKTQAVGSFNAKFEPMRAHEDIMVFSRKTPTFNLHSVSRYPEETINSAASIGRAFMPSLLRFKKDSQVCALHSTQKPRLLLQLLIEAFSHPGDTVLDFTMGSASTGVAALLTGRRFIGIEMDRHYFRIAS
ncbi:MAG: DNA-methyltransferase, partial [Terrimicrobiaceae bacterium]